MKLTLYDDTVSGMAAILDQSSPSLAGALWTPGRPFWPRGSGSAAAQPAAAGGLSSVSPAPSHCRSSDQGQHSTEYLTCNWA